MGCDGHCGVVRLWRGHFRAMLYFCSHAVHDIFICCLGVVLCLFGLIVAIVVAILDHTGMKKMGLADIIQQESNNMVRVISVIVVLCKDLL